MLRLARSTLLRQLLRLEGSLCNMLGAFLGGESSTTWFRPHTELYGRRAAAPPIHRRAAREGLHSSRLRCRR
jgi:hypothetical protein